MVKETSLKLEINKMKKAIEFKLKSFYPPKKPTKLENIYQILKSSSRCKISKIEEKKIKNVISEKIKDKLPIPILFKWAYSLNSKNEYKFIQTINAPRLGDFWTFYYLDMINHI